MKTMVTTMNTAHYGDKQQMTRQEAMISFGGAMLPATIDIETTPVVVESTSLDGFNEILREFRKPTTTEISGKLTLNDVDNMFNALREGTRLFNDEPYFMMSPKMYFWLYWSHQYALQGKRYPSMKKRKSKARMAKRWRTM